MSILEFYADRIEELTCSDGSKQKALVQRRGKSQVPKTIVDGKIFIVDLNCTLGGGDYIKRPNEEEYFVISKQSSADCIQLQGRRINAKVGLYEIADIYTNHKKTGTQAKSVAVDVPVYYQDVSASMKTYDAGLLSTTVKKFIFRNTVPVKLLHRIVLGDRNYQVDNIDTAKYIGLYEVQVSADTRK